MASFAAYGLVTGRSIIVTKTFTFKRMVLASTIGAINPGLTSCTVDSSPASMASGKLSCIFKKDFSIFYNRSLLELDFVYNLQVS